MKKATRAERIIAAASAIHDRGEQPTSRKVLAEMDGRGFGPGEFPNGMGGEDLRVFAVVMECLGYRRVLAGDGLGSGNRWRRLRP